MAYPYYNPPPNHHHGTFYNGGGHPAPAFPPGPYGAAPPGPYQAPPHHHDPNMYPPNPNPAYGYGGGHPAPGFPPGPYNAPPNPNPGAYNMGYPPPANPSYPPANTGYPNQYNVPPSGPYGNVMSPFEPSGVVPSNTYAANYNNTVNGMSNLSLGTDGTNAGGQNTGNTFYSQGGYNQANAPTYNTGTPAVNTPQGTGTYNSGSSSLSASENIHQSGSGSTSQSNIHTSEPGKPNPQGGLYTTGSGLSNPQIDVVYTSSSGVPSNNTVTSNSAPPHSPVGSNFTSSSGIPNSPTPIANAYTPSSPMLTANPSVFTSTSGVSTSSLYVTNSGVTASSSAYSAGIFATTSGTEVGATIVRSSSVVPSAAERMRTTATMDKVSKERVSADQIKPKKEDIKQFNGRAPLISLDWQFSEPANDIFIAKMQSGAQMTLYSDYEMKMTVTVVLSEDGTMLRYANHGFIYLKHVNEIKKGKKADALRIAPCDENLCFSLVYGPNSINFEAASPEDRDFWAQGLIYAITKCKQANCFTDLIKAAWLKDFTPGESISFDQAVKLIETLSEANFIPSDVDLKTKFAKVDLNRDGKVQLPEFVALVRAIRQFTSIEHVFTKYSKNGQMDTQNFIRFTKIEQKETITEEVAKGIFSSLHQSSHGCNTINFELFSDYLNDPYYNNVFDTENCGFVYQDMTKPISWYYFYSSHNTYCSSDQLKGKASVEMYAKALRDGCRCVELDIWDGRDRPIILHGNTLMKEIDFIDVIKCIRDNAFVSSKYPIILSLENHCSKEMQEKMAVGFETVFGNFLAKPPPSLPKLPSPDELQYKILLKGPISASYYDDPSVAEISQNKKPDRICDQLTRITYLRATHLISMNQPSKNPLEISSFEETKHERIANTQPQDMINYCKIQMARIYPKGTRVDSSNYLPITGWNMGCQLVALNVQTPDEPLWINDSKFEDNGCCGLVLKPPIMMELEKFNISDNPKWYQQKNPNSVHGTLVVHVIGARMLPAPKTGTIFKKKPQPTITLQMVGTNRDWTEHKCEIIGNSLSIPHWDHKFLFPVNFGEGAFLLFRIDCKKQGVRIANASVNVKTLRSGYRSIPLRNYLGNPSPFASLLVHFVWKDT